MPTGNREVKAKSWTTTAILTLVEPLIRRLIRRALNGAGIGGDTIEHGTLGGLSDDDHAQYLLDVAGTGGLGITVSGRIISVDLGDIDHNLLLNFLADEHIDWTGTTRDFNTSGLAATGALTVTGNIVVSGLVDGRDVAVDGTKLDAIDDDAMLAPIGLSMGNLTDTTSGLDNDVTHFLYLGRTMRAITAATFLCRVTTAYVQGSGGTPWAEIGVFTGEVVPNGNASLTRVGFTNVAAIFNTTGIKAVNIPILSGTSIGDGLWLAWGSKVGLLFGTVVQLRGMLADDIQSGIMQGVAGRLSTLSVPKATILEVVSIAPAWARLKI